MAAAPSKRRAGSSSSYSGGGGVSLWLFLWGAGLAATVAVMAAVMTVPLKPEVELAAGKPFAPPVALEEVTCGVDFRNAARSFDWCFIPPADDQIAVMDIKATIP